MRLTKCVTSYISMLNTSQLSYMHAVFLFLLEIESGETRTRLREKLRFFSK